MHHIEHDNTCTASLVYCTFPVELWPIYQVYGHRSCVSGMRAWNKDILFLTVQQQHGKEQTHTTVRGSTRETTEWREREPAWCDLQCTASKSPVWHPITVCVVSLPPGALFSVLIRVQFCWFCC